MSILCKINKSLKSLLYKEIENILLSLSILKRQAKNWRAKLGLNFLLSNLFRNNSSISLIHKYWKIFKYCA